MGLLFNAVKSVLGQCVFSHHKGAVTSVCDGRTVHGVQGHEPKSFIDSQGKHLHECRDFVKNTSRQWHYEKKHLYITTVHIVLISKTKGCQQNLLFKFTPNSINDLSLCLSKNRWYIWLRYRDYNRKQMNKEVVLNAILLRNTLVVVLPWCFVLCEPWW